MNKLCESIKSKINCIGVMSLLGVPMQGDRAVSFRDGATNKTALRINEDSFYDYSTDSSGDCINLYAGYKNLELREAISELAMHLKIESKTEKKYSRMEMIYHETANIFHQELLKNKEIMEYIVKERGISEQTIRKMRLGWCDNPYALTSFSKEDIEKSGLDKFSQRIMFPYFKMGRVVNFMGKGFGQIPYLKMKSNDYNETTLYNFISRGSNDIYITEGNFDVATLVDKGKNVIGLSSGAIPKALKEDFYNMIQNKNVYLMTDYDPETESGQNFQKKLSQELFERAHVNVNIIDMQRFSNGGKADVNSCRDRGDLFDQSYKYSHSHIATITDINELELFVKKFARISSKVELVELKSYYTKENPQKLDKEIITHCFKEATKCPSEDFVLKEFIESGDYIFNKKRGWFKHSDKNKLWELKDPEQILKQITEILGSFKKGNLMKSIQKLAEVYMHSSEELNKSNLINFKNTMYDPKTGETLPYDKRHMSTIKINYNYDKSAKCPKWEQAINVIADENQERINCIQEMFGYCLTKDTKFNKAFFLIGGGSNGKSFVTKTLKGLIGEENISHLELSQLGDNFDRMSLYNKLVNIGSETKTNVHGCEDQFKKITDGEVIRGAFKGVDALEFKPYCKMIFQMNNMPGGSDASAGYSRRIQFIEFPISFTVGNLTRKNQRKAVPGLDLSEELSGIFNWAMIGYKRLYEQGKFSSPIENERLQIELAEITSPINAFLLDEGERIIAMGRNLLDDDYITVGRKELYEAYQIWAHNTGRKTATNTKFTMDLRSKLGYWIENIRQTNGRAFKMPKSCIRNFKEILKESGA